MVKNYYNANIVRGDRISQQMVLERIMLNTSRDFRGIEWLIIENETLKG